MRRDEFLKGLAALAATSGLPLSALLAQVGLAGREGAYPRQLSLGQQRRLSLARAFAAEGCGVVAVLHDLNQAARYATHLVVMKDGRVVATGAPAEVLTAELVEQVFGLPCLIAADPVTGTPTVVPLDRRRRS